MIQGFFRLNIRFCNWIESFLPTNFDFSLQMAHRKMVAELCGRRTGQLVLDVGGGRVCPFVPFFAGGTDVDIVALDISEEELRENEDTNMVAVADATRPLPLASQSADIIATSSVIEHLEVTAPFIEEAHRVLRPGGHMVNVFPCRFAPFSIVNQLLPNRVARAVLYYFYPEWREECGFRAYYDHCYYSAMKSQFERQGFEIVEMRLRYYQAIYYKFFVPFYLLMLLYDATIAVLGIRNLCCQIMLVARRRSDTAGTGVGA